MNTRAMILSVIALCALALTACSGGGSGSPPAPAPAPTTGTIQVLQSGTAIFALSFSTAGQPAAATIAISQPGNSAFQETNTCSSGAAPVATIAQSNPNGTSYVITPMNAGACNITFAGGGGTTLVLPITVTLTQVPIN